MSRHEGRIEALRAAVIDSKGALDSSIRRAAVEDGELPAEVAAYADRVRKQAHTVTDEDIEALRGIGYSDDEIFELTVSLALGAGLRRLAIFRRAMKGED